MAKFQLGRLCMTRGVNDDVAENNAFAQYVGACIERYIVCDWGSCGEHDSQCNDEAVQNNDARIFAAYTHDNHPDWKIWIITEADRSYTTILYPSEY